MATIHADNTFTQVVRFDVDPDRQSRLLAVIAAEVERWVSRRPGFISASFHASGDGRHVLNYAQWRDEAAFDGFTTHPESRHLQAAIRAVDPSLKPHAVSYRVVRCVESRE